MKKLCLICSKNEFEENIDGNKKIMCDECWDKYIVPRVQEMVSFGVNATTQVVKKCEFCGGSLTLAVEESWRTMHQHCWNEYQNQQNPTDTRMKNDKGEPLCLSCGEPLDKEDHALDRKWVVRHKACHNAHKASQGTKK